MHAEIGVIRWLENRSLSDSEVPLIYGLRLVQAHHFKGVRDRLPARGPQAVYAFMAPIAAREVVEIYWILALDAQHNIVRNAPIIIATGTVNSAFAHLSMIA